MQSTATERRTAKAAQSSSGEKQTAVAAPDVTEAAGSAGESVARVSGRAIENTQKLWRISLNSLLPRHKGARPLHAATAPAITAPVVRIPIVVRIGRVRRLSLGHRPLSASAERQYDQCQPEWSKQLHFTPIGSIKLGSLFLTLPTRGLTGQHVISADG